MKTQSFNVLKLWLLSLLCLWSLTLGICTADTLIDTALKGGFGVRPMGMGGAFVAIADDSNAVYYNPGAMLPEKTYYTRGYFDSNTDFYDDYGGYSLVSNQSAIASWNVVNKSGSRVGVTAFSMSRIGENGITWGITLKNVAWTYASTADRGYTGDLGIKAPINHEITAGVLFQDVLKNGVPVASTIRPGIAYVPYFMRNAVFAGDCEITNLKSSKAPTLRFHYGSEIKLADSLVIRGGWDKDRFTAGATIKFPLVVAEYALILNIDQKNTHMIGFRLGGEDS